MAGTTNDEELLILSDDTDIGSEFVLEEQIIDNNNTISTNNELISFDSDLSGFDVSISDSLDDGNSLLQETKNTDEFLLSLDDIKTESFNEPETISIEQGTDLMENQETVDLKEETIESDLFSPEIDNEPVINQTVGTMADILDEAIAKFARREDVIASSIASREEHIKSLKEQIASLESAVNTDNEEVTRLNTEKQSIVKNRKALEKMKEAPATTK